MPQRWFMRLSDKVYLLGNHELQICVLRWQNQQSGDSVTWALLWLRFLALASFHTREILRLKDATLGPSHGGTALHEGLLLFVRFLACFLIGPKEHTLPLRYVKSLTNTQSTALSSTVEEIASDYARHSSRDWDGFYPFEALRNHYKGMTRDLGIRWRTFIERGAFRACIRHYLCQLYPHEFNERFIKELRRSPKRVAGGSSDEEDDDDEDDRYAHEWNQWNPPRRPYLRL